MVIVGRDRTVLQKLGGAFICCAALVGCDLRPGDPVAVLEQNLIEQRCAINIAALGDMRKRGILPDPDMVAGCDTRARPKDVDITPRPDVPRPTSADAEALRFDLVARRMNPQFADDLMTSEAFEDYVLMYGQWKSLRP